MQHRNKKFILKFVRLFKGFNHFFIINIYPSMPEDTATKQMRIYCTLYVVIKYVK